jgi:hypothetical protein
VSKGREDAALDVLAHSHANEDKEDEVVQFAYRGIVGTIELEIAAKETKWRQLWKGRENQSRLFIMIVRTLPTNLDYSRDGLLLKHLYCGSVLMV